MYCELGSWVESFEGWTALHLGAAHGFEEAPVRQVEYEAHSCGGYLCFRIQWLQVCHALLSHPRFTVVTAQDDSSLQW